MLLWQNLCCPSHVSSTDANQSAVFFYHATLAVLLDRFFLHGCSSQGATVQKAGGDEGCALQAKGFHWCHFASDFVALTCEQLYAAGAKMRCRRQGL